MLNFIEIPSFICTFKIQDHFKIKPVILDLIKEQGTFSFVKGGQKLSSTDYFMNKIMDERPYVKVLSPHIELILKEFNSKFNYSKVDTNFVWYQQYEKGDFHNWHAHFACNFSAVYYLELSEESPTTTFKHLDKEFTVDVTEGEVIIFPSYIMHCSKPNQGNRKTVFSFNINAI